VPNLALIMADNPESQQWKDGISRIVSDHITDSDLKISDAAKIAGVSPRTMARILSGKRDLNLLEAYRLGIVKPIGKTRESQ